MGDEKKQKFILSNLKVLTASTVIGSEFIVSLIANSLINDAEKRLLCSQLDSGAPNVTRAIMIYTETFNRWSPTQFQQFKKILKETGNIKALQVFSIPSTDSLPNKEQHELLQEHRERKAGGFSKDVSKEDAVVIPILQQSEESSETSEKKINKSDGSKDDMKLLELLKKTDVRNLSTFIDEIETARELVKTFSEEELFLLLMKEETRVTDIIGRSPQDVSVALGEQLIPCEVLANFRAKFPTLRRTVFGLAPDYTGLEFCVDYLWWDLIREMEKRNDDGPVTLALREAMFSMDDTSQCLLDMLEEEGKGLRNVSHPCDQLRLEIAEGVIDWVVDAGSFWKGVETSLDCSMLPYLVHYSGNLEHVTKFLVENKGKLDMSVDDAIHVMRSLILLCSNCQDNDENVTSAFTQIVAFLQENKIPGELKSLVEVLVTATREEIKLAIPQAYRFVCDVSIGTVFLKLTHNLTVTVDKETWKCVVREIIYDTPCCELPAVFLRLIENKSLIKLLHSILANSDVLHIWQVMFSSEYRKGGYSFCRLNHLLSFYFSMFGLNVEWMKGSLVRKLPVEISRALEENPFWRHLPLSFQQIVKKVLRDDKVNNVGKLAHYYNYRTEAEWDRLIEIIKQEEEFFQPGDETCDVIPCDVAGPFIRVLLNKFGTEWTKLRVTPAVWKQIRSKGSSIKSLGSLLHSAIELGEAEEVNRRAWPGLLSWRNSGGKTALEIAKEKLGENQPITQLIQNFSLYTHANL